GQIIPISRKSEDGQKIIDIVTRTFWNCGIECEFLKIDRITNETLQHEFRQIKDRLTKSGLKYTELRETFAFTYRGNRSMLKAICDTGLRVEDNPRRSILGDATKGVHLWMSADLCLAKISAPLCKIIMYKIIKGRIKQVAPNFDTSGPDSALQPPTPGFNCHSSANIPMTDTSLDRLMTNSQLYLYDMDGHGKCSKRPRQVLPYAVLSFKVNVLKVREIFPTLEPLVMEHKEEEKPVNLTDLMKTAHSVYNGYIFNKGNHLAHVTMLCGSKLFFPLEKKLAVDSKTPLEQFKLLLGDKAKQLKLLWKQDGSKKDAQLVFLRADEDKYKKRIKQFATLLDQSKSVGVAKVHREEFLLCLLSGKTLQEEFGVENNHHTSLFGVFNWVREAPQKEDPEKLKVPSLERQRSSDSKSSEKSSGSSQHGSHGISSRETSLSPTKSSVANSKSTSRGKDVADLQDFCDEAEKPWKIGEDLHPQVDDTKTSANDTLYETPYEVILAQRKNPQIQNVNPTPINVRPGIPDDARSKVPNSAIETDKLKVAKIDNQKLCNIHIQSSKGTTLFKESQNEARKESQSETKSDKEISNQHKKVKHRSRSQSKITSSPKKETKIGISLIESPKQDNEKLKLKLQQLKTIFTPPRKKELEHDLDCLKAHSSTTLKDNAKVTGNAIKPEFIVTQVCSSESQEIVCNSKAATDIDMQ
ncbi:unnamed protein product, partial [Owenia fusiformis]